MGHMLRIRFVHICMFGQRVKVYLAWRKDVDPRIYLHPQLIHTHTTNNVIRMVQPTTVSQWETSDASSKLWVWNQNWCQIHQQFIRATHSQQCQPQDAPAHAVHTQCTMVQALNKFGIKDFAKMIPSAPIFQLSFSNSLSLLKSL